MSKRLSFLFALFCATPALTLAQTSATSTTNGVVSLTVPMQVLAPAGCAVAFSSAGTVPVITVSNCPAGTSTPPEPPPPPTPPPPPVPAPTPDPTPPPRGASPAAFPGAQGGGAASLGGRGGAVIEVTNTNDSGAGSLRACIMASGPRTCVFRVSGLITFRSRAQISNPYLTIAGQTAPGGGIVIGGANQQGEQIFVSTHDVTIRYLTYDGNNPNTPTGPDTGTVCCEMASGNVYNVIWDHISARWMGNKAFPVVSNVSGMGIHNMDIQWSLLYEPNWQHAVGIGTVYVSEGSGRATTDDDAHHNMFVSVDHRLPLNQSGRNVRWVNNIVYNWGMFAALSMGGVQTDYIGNKYVDGNGCLSPGQNQCLNYQNTHVFLANGNGCDPKDPAGDCPNGDNQTGPTLYLLNNTGRTGSQRGSAMVTPTNVVNDAGQVSMTAQGWEGGDTGNPNSSGPMPSSWFRSTPLPAEQFPIIADDVNNLDNVLLPTVGNSQHLTCDGTWASNRDSQDARIIGVYQNGKADDLFNGQYPAPAIPAGTPCVESLHDGISDQWKQAHGLSISDRNLYKTLDKSGYTYLELYLAGSGAVSPPPPPPPQPPPAPKGSGWLGSDALAGTLAIGSSVTVNSNAGPVRSAACTAGSAPASLLNPQPSQVTGATVTIIGGPSPACSNGIVYWQVQFGAAPAAPTPR